MKLDILNPFFRLVISQEYVLCTVLELRLVYLQQKQNCGPNINKNQKKHGHVYCLTGHPVVLLVICLPESPDVLSEPSLALDQCEHIVLTQNQLHLTS